MTHHSLGSEKIAHSSHAVMEHIASRWNGGRHRRSKYMPKPSVYLPRISKRHLIVEVHESAPVNLDDRRLDIDHLLMDLIPRKAPGAKTIYDRYVFWCKLIGRHDIYNRRLARRFLKLMRRNAV